jgi:hypothetical protein
MRATRLYTDATGSSAFEDLTLALERAGVEQCRSLLTPSAMTFNQTDPGHQYDWHNAPQKQWVVTLQGEIEVQLRNGTARRFGPGSILLAEDTTGSGHATRVVSSAPWQCLYLPFNGRLD